MQAQLSDDRAAELREVRVLLGLDEVSADLCGRFLALDLCQESSKSLAEVSKLRSLLEVRACWGVLACF